MFAGAERRQHACFHSAMKFSIRRLYARAPREAEKRMARQEQEGGQEGEGEKRARDVKDF